MNPPLIKTTNANWRTGVKEKLKPKSYSLVYPNGVVVLGAAEKPYPYIKAIKKNYPLAEIKPNY